ncbi:MAG: 4Fe-4S binding protein [Clostridia bacterium]|nr:4Fe-4S binding protein [Clostridia bacterium]
MEEELSKVTSNILKDGNAAHFHTGSWRNKTPIHSKEKCKNCMLCVAYCPEDCIKQKEGVLTDIDLNYCKGCGVCAKVCPFKAIEMDEKKEV